MNCTLKESFAIAYDGDMYTQLVCRAVARSHQDDWRHKRRLKEENGRAGSVWTTTAEQKGTPAVERYQMCFDKGSQDISSCNDTALILYIE